ncbi:MAG: hypothetical protein U0232_33805, partial [Thermomicrobiales bacterium]
ARQFVLQLTLLSGWLLLFYTPATQTLLNWLDEYGWRKSYALTSPIPAHQAELAVRAAERNQIVAVVAYLLLLLPTLGLAWLPAIAFLTDSLHQKPSPDPLGNA